jgi:molybdate transport system substrate-binding protein
VTFIACARTPAVLAIMLAAVAGCGATQVPTSGDREPEILTVFAASSLRNAFTTIGADFERSHPGVRVRFSFGGSQDLVEQVYAGGPADVLATADEASMDSSRVPTAVDPKPFATNTLEIAVPKGNPARVSSLADLGRPGLKLVICAVEVPCGTATAAVAKIAGVTLRPVSREQSVVDVVGKVASGEADAGIVYVTDIRGSKGAVEGVEFPEAKQVVNVYPIARLADSKHAKLAGEFVASVCGGAGHRVLADAGFGSP